MTDLLEAMRQRVPVLAARLDSRLAEDVRRLRAEAAAGRAAAVRHRATATEMQREAVLREKMRTTAPIRHARETDERAAAASVQRGGPLPAQVSPPAAPPPSRSPLVPLHGPNRGPRPPVR